MYEKFMYLFWSSYQYASLLVTFLGYIVWNIFIYAWYTYFIYLTYRDAIQLPWYIRFLWENYQINEYLSVFLAILSFIFVNYIIFIIWKKFKFKKLNIDENNKNYFLIYAKFVPVWYIVSNFLLWWNSKYNYKKVFLYWLLWVWINLIFMSFYSLIIYLINKDKYFDIEYLIVLDLFLNNLLFIIFTIFYFIKKRSR